MAKEKASSAKAAAAIAKDTAAPPSLLITISCGGEQWGQIIAEGKDFATGSVGFYANGKVVNPKTMAKYQLGANIILIGSKK